MIGGLTSALALLLQPDPVQIVAGDLRIEILSDSLVRIEKKGPNGFEDRETFNVVNRNFKPCDVKSIPEGDRLTIRTERYELRLPRVAHQLSDVTVVPNNATPYRLSDKPVKSQFLPSPNSMPPTWALSDNPRLVPPKWGATPPPTDIPGSGWDRGNDAPDTYVFIPTNYEQLREDFLALTGKIEKPPLYAFGFIDSRYHPYTEKEAVSVIDTYRKKKIPLDLFTVDTDWRINGSHGYATEVKYFPDMSRFLKEAHDRNVRVMFNDHPEPVAQDGLDPKELKYRYEGLTKLLGMGVDVWWFDRNWGVTLKEPMPGLAHEEWGQRIYHDITQRFRPDQRPLIMTNFQGIDNGNRNYAPQPAGHRYPIWWTGDTGSTWQFLQKGVANGVDMGLMALAPYVGEDLGGHQGDPSPELYVRFLQYGCLSPTTRVHCTRGKIRYPWEFGSEAEKITTDFIRLRYRLLPTIYSAAQRAYNDGTPILRRLDLETPKSPGADRSDQYLLGDDILVAPIVTSETGDAKPVSSDGLKAEFFTGTELQGQPILTRTDKQISFHWGDGSPDPKVPDDKFSARWTGQLEAAPKSGDYTFALSSDDGVRLWVNGKKVIDAWKPLFDITNTAKVHLEAGEKANIRLEYFEATGGANVILGWIPPADNSVAGTQRQVWIPPGEWRSVYSGEIVRGPRTINTRATLDQCPMWVRNGGIVALAPDMQYTGEKPWDTLTLDAWVPTGDAVSNRVIAEDDGISNAYQKGAVLNTRLLMLKTGDKVTLTIKPDGGSFAGMPNNRSWTVRLNLPDGYSAKDVKLDGKAVSASVVRGAAGDKELFPAGSRPTANVTTCVVRIPKGATGKSHVVTLNVAK